MATRFKKVRTRKLRRKHALKTRRQRGGLNILKLLGLKKEVAPLSSSTLPSPKQNKSTFTTKNPSVGNVQANITMRKINAEMQRWKNQQKPNNRKISQISDPSNLQ